MLSTSKMEANAYGKISLKDFEWLNKPAVWNVNNDVLTVTTEKSDFWRETHYGFTFSSGHVFGVEIKDNFSFTVCVEADYKTLYDQAGLMIYIDEKNWLKTGIEFNDEQCMISSVRTVGQSDWATGIFSGDPRKFWLRLTRQEDVVCVKYSIDNKKWDLLRLCPFPKAEWYFVGPMCCTPKRDGLNVKFSGIKVELPAEDILHCN